MKYYRKNTSKLMALLMLLFTFAYQAKAQNASLVSDSILTTSPSSCDSVKIQIETYTGCSNISYNGYTLSKTGATITVNLNYSLGPVCLGVINYNYYTINLGLLPVGTDTINSSVYLNSTKVNSLSSILSVASCCPVNSLLAANFNFNDSIVCLGDSILFTNQSINFDSVKWIIDGNNYSRDSNLVYLTDSIGIHSITLVADSGFCSDSITKSFMVVGFPNINLGNDTTICNDTIIILSIQDSTLSYLWQDSSTSNYYMVDTSGVYWVTASNAAGCSITDTINVTVTVCTSIDKNKTEGNRLTTYPNPTNGWLNLNLNNGEYGLYHYQILDISGKIIKNGEIKLTNSPSSIDLGAFPSGIYFLQIQKGDLHINQKVTKN